MRVDSSSFSRIIFSRGWSGWGIKPWSREQFRDSIEDEVRGSGVHASDFLGADAQIAGTAFKVGNEFAPASVKLDFLMAGGSEDYNHRNFQADCNVQRQRVSGYHEVAITHDSREL